MVIRPANTIGFLTVLLGVLMSACAPDTEGTQQRAIERGAESFDKNCGACHGQQGRGPSMEDLRALAPDALREAIRNHPTAGQIPERLSAARVQEIIEYLEE